MDNKTIAGLLNPIRMRIVQLLLKKVSATKKDIACDLPNVPQASLYRHIKKLLEDDIIEIEKENKIRGTYERVYRLKKNPLHQLEELGASATPEQLNQIYYVFAMSLISEFSNYVARDDVNLINDKVGFRSYPIYMSDSECDEFIGGFGSLLMKFINNEPNQERRLRNFSFSFLPIDEKPNGDK